MVVGPDRRAEVEPPTSDYTPQSSAGASPSPPKAPASATPEADPASQSTPPTGGAETHSQSIVYPRLDDQSPPENIGRYQIRRQLGMGGFGRVYLAWDEVLHREVALKVPHQEILAAPGRQQAFLAEARMAARLRHAGVVVVHDVGWDDESGGYVVYEYVPGRTLRERITGEPWQPVAAATLAMAVAQALHAAHQQGLVHRDLKPGNILLDANDRPRIADFGMAVDEQSQRSLRGEIAGTWAYMSPEQVRGESHHLDGRTDLWSLGVILYELLAGRRPFNGRTDELTAEILEREPRPLRQVNERVSRRLEAICLRCLAKPLGQRYPSALDLIEDLEALLKDGAESSRTSGTIPPAPLTLPQPTFGETGSSVRELAPPPPASLLPWFISGVVLVCAVVVGMWLGGLFSGPENRGPTKPGDPAAPGVDHAALEPDVWHNLLAQKPRPLVWTEHASGSRWSADDQEMWVTSSFPALFELAKTDEQNYQFRVTIQQTPWVGRIGVFLGHQELAGDPTGVQFELISLDALDPRDNTRFAIKRELISMDRGGTQRPRKEKFIAKAEVNQPAPEPLRLLCEVRGGKLVAVHFAERELPQLLRVPPEIASTLVPLTGRLGVFLTQSSGDFRQPMFRFTRESTP